MDALTTEIPVKIYIRPIPAAFKPAKSPFNYPSYSDDWGIEQDFLAFLECAYPGTVSSRREADWEYIPIFWTRYHLWNNFGKTGREELESYIKESSDTPLKTFTICQYDDGPLVNLGSTVVFEGSRKRNDGYDAPLLASGLPKVIFPPKKKYLASFTGRVHTHPIRAELEAAVLQRPTVFFSNSQTKVRAYARSMLRASIALCPRGYGGSSFRFFEAIELGIIPWLIGDIDVRPFKSQIDWESCSFFSPNVEDFVSRFDRISEADLRQKAQTLKEVAKKFKFGRWCESVLIELTDLK